jgi:hypothetical protein
MGKKGMIGRGRLRDFARTKAYLWGSALVPNVPLNRLGLPCAGFSDHPRQISVKSRTQAFQSEECDRAHSLETLRSIFRLSLPNRKCAAMRLQGAGTVQSDADDTTRA